MLGFSVGGVLGRSFSVWLKNLVPFTLLSALVYSPLIIYTLVIFSDLTLKSLQTWSLVAPFLALVLGLVATGAISYGTFMQLRGQSASLGKCITVGLQRLLPALAVGVVVGIIVGLGFLALVVPGIILYCMLYVAMPAAVIERPGIGGALKRSADLTKGYKGHIFGLLFILGVIQRIVQWILETATVGDQARTMSDVKTYLIVTAVFIVVWGALQSVASAVAYHDLRATKEGTATEELARVFE